MNIAGVYENEIRQHFSIEDLMQRIIRHQPEVELHLFSLPARGLGKVQPELSQPTGYLRSYTYKQQ